MGFSESIQRYLSRCILKLLVVVEIQRCDDLVSMWSKIEDSLRPSGPELDARISGTLGPPSTML